MPYLIRSFFFTLSYFRILGYAALWRGAIPFRQLHMELGRGLYLNGGGAGGVAVESQSCVLASRAASSPVLLRCKLAYQSLLLRSTDGAHT